MNFDSTQDFIIAIVTAIIGVAIVALLISNNSKTTQVIGAAAGGFGTVLQVALSPVTGNSPIAAAAPTAGNSGVFSPGGGGTITNTGIPSLFGNLSGALNTIQGIFN